MHLPFLLAAAVSAASSSTDWESLFKGVHQSVFEVVLPKPVDTGAKYVSALPWENIPIRQRKDSVWSVGTAFAVGSDTLVTAAHVLWRETEPTDGVPAIRDAAGRIHRIGKFLKFGLAEDLVMFTCPGLKVQRPLKPAPEPRIGQVVHAVGNALGEGVVLRDGLLTSRTPEEVSGEWEWIRFSAAASPGNSGGPLIDAQGRILGIVLARSEAENLNFALPWRVVANFPANRLRVRLSTPVTSAFLEGYLWRESLDTTLAIPSSWHDLRRALDSVQIERLARQRRLLDGAAGEFPSRFHSMVTARPIETPLPFPLYRDDRERWQVNWIGPPVTDAPADGGRWTQASWGDVLFAHFRLPDSVTYNSLLRDSRRLGNRLLATTKLERPMGNASIRATSLGGSNAESTHVDRWGRKWAWRSWRIPWSGRGWTALLLPQPCGFQVIVLETPQPRFEGPEGLFLRDLSDLTMGSWHGTAPQWSVFLSDTTWNPPFLRDLRISSTIDRATASWNGTAFSLLPPYIGPGYASVSIVPAVDPGPAMKGMMGIGSIQMSPERNAEMTLALSRFGPPGAFEGEESLHNWELFRTATPPYDGTPVQGGERTSATQVFPRRDESAGRVWAMRVTLRAGSTPWEYRQALSSARSRLTLGKADFPAMFDSLTTAQ
jgi:hypothetical protein